LNELTSSFEDQEKNKSWYLGTYPIGLGNTNNSLGGFNTTFEKNFSNFQKQDIVKTLNKQDLVIIGIFLSMMKQIVLYLSSELPNPLPSDEELYSKKEGEDQSAALSE